MFRNAIEDYEFGKIIQTVNEKEKNRKLAQVRVAILRNITLDPIVPYLKFLCLEDGFKSDVYIGEYNNVLQDVLNPESSLYKHNPDVIIVCLKLEVLSNRITRYFTGMSHDEINKDIEGIIGNIDLILKGIRKQSNSIVLINNFEVPVCPSFGIYDYQKHFNQVNTIRNINLQLLSLVDRHENCYIVDFDLIQSYVGYKDFINTRYWHIGKAPYSREALMVIAEEYMKFIRASLGRNRKCLVLDCDNTLWGGIIGEDGIDGIKLGKTYPGSEYLEFQQSVLDHYERGVILAICSKNNKEDVLGVLNRHPDSVLREEHFAVIMANWNDKVSNIKEIAKELDIGLDSMVFIDDSDFEANMVSECLPEVRVISLPKDSTKYRDILASCGLFDSLALSEEDRRRGGMYRSEFERKNLKVKSTSLEQYFASLETEVIIGNADSYSIPRIAQLTQRTNQFNLTTKRYSESDIKNFAESENCEVWNISLKDRFGESGIIGVAIINSNDNFAEIDSLLISCRVIGRGVEDILLKHCIERSKIQGKKKIYGYYIKTKKNSPVSGFYEKRGFIIENQSGIKIKYTLLLDRPLFNIPNYFKSIKIVNKEN